MCCIVWIFWSIENKPHYSPDVAFKEYESRKMTSFSSENFSVIIKIALGILQNNKTSKLNIKKWRIKVWWNEEFIEYLVFKIIKCFCPVHNCTFF